MLFLQQPLCFGQGRVLRVFNYSEYIDGEVLNLFEEETGIDVIYDEYESTEEAWAKLKVGGAGYDVVIMAYTHIKLAIDQGLVQKINKTRIPNIINLDPEISVNPADPMQEYTVPYMWGTTGIAYLDTAVDNPPTTWSTFLDKGVLEKYKGKVSLLVEFLDVVQAAMIKLGYNPAEQSNWNDDVMDEVIRLLKDIKPYLVGFYGAGQYMPELVAGRLYLAQTWSGDVLVVKEENPDVEYVLPEDGALYWMDFIVIPRDAKSVDEAHEFINFLLRPDIAARNVKAVLYSSPLSRDVLRQYAEQTNDGELLELLENPLLYPPESVNLVPNPVLDEDVLRMIERVRTEVQAPERGIISTAVILTVVVAAVIVVSYLMFRRKRS
jgi:spermidine/putrescine-binding protein